MYYCGNQRLLKDQPVLDQKSKCRFLEVDPKVIQPLNVKPPQINLKNFRVIERLYEKLSVYQRYLSEIYDRMKRIDLGQDYISFRYGFEDPIHGHFLLSTKCTFGVFSYPPNHREYEIFQPRDRFGRPVRRFEVYKTIGGPVDETFPNALRSYVNRGFILTKTNIQPYLGLQIGGRTLRDIRKNMRVSHREIVVSCSRHQILLEERYRGRINFLTVCNKGVSQKKAFISTTETTKGKEKVRNGFTCKTEDFEGDFEEEGVLKVKKSNHTPKEYAICGYKITSLSGEDRAVVKLGVFEDSKIARSQIDGKCRADKCRVLAIGKIVKVGEDIWYDFSHSEATSCVHISSSGFKYLLGKTVKVDDFDSDLKVVCVPGIHFYLTQEEALDNFWEESYSLILNEKEMLSADFSESGPPPAVSPPRPIQDSKDDLEISIPEEGPSSLNILKRPRPTKDLDQILRGADPRQLLESDGTPVLRRIKKRRYQEAKFLSERLAALDLAI